MDIVRIDTCPTCGNQAQRQWATKGAFRLMACRRCGFVFVNPRPSRAWLADWYAGMAGPTESATEPLPSPGGPDRVADGLALLSARTAGVRYLDVGAGYGDDVLRAVAAGCEVLAIEPGRAAAAICARRSGIMPWTTPFEDTHLAAHAFDLILANQVFEHVFDPAVWFAECTRLLAPAGVLCVSLPNFNSLFRYAMGRNDPFISPPAHLNFFSRRTLTRLAARHGLAPLACRYHTHLSAVTIRKRLPPVLRPLARAVSDPVSRGLDRSGLGVLLTMYFRASEAA